MRGCRNSSATAETLQLGRERERSPGGVLVLQGSRKALWHYLGNKNIQLRYIFLRQCMVLLDSGTNIGRYWKVLEGSKHLKIFMCFSHLGIDYHDILNHHLLKWTKPVLPTLGLWLSETKVGDVGCSGLHAIYVLKNLGSALGTHGMNLQNSRCDRSMVHVEASIWGLFFYPPLELTTLFSFSLPRIFSQVTGSPMLMLILWVSNLKKNLHFAYPIYVIEFWRLVIWSTYLHALDL